MKLNTPLKIQGVISILLLILFCIFPEPLHFYILAGYLCLCFYEVFFWAFAVGHITISLIILPFMLFGCILFFGELYTKVGIVNDSGTVNNDLLTCVYFSLVTFTTLGYGDFQPTEAGRILAGIEAFLGYIFMALFVAMIILKFQKAGKKLKGDEKSNSD